VTKLNFLMALTGDVAILSIIGGFPVDVKARKATFWVRERSEV
jgi:hypothetical protein